MTTTTNANRPNQLFGEIRQINNDSFSTYHGLSTIYRQRAFHGLDMMLGYTWAHNLDTSPDSNGGGTLMIQNNLRADYADSNWDIRSRFVGTVAYVMPDLPMLGHVGNKLLGGWHANTIVTLQTGFPYNVSITDDRAHVLNRGTQRPNFVHTANNTCSRQTRIGNGRCIDVTAFSLPALGTFGNVHRNSVHGPGSANVNFSMSKDFGIFERLKFQLRAEAFNLFNHPNIANPNSALPAYNFTQNAFDLTSSNFGNISAMQTSYTPRTLQLAGKLNF